MQEFGGIIIIGVIALSVFAFAFYEASVSVSKPEQPSIRVTHEAMFSLVNGTCDSTSGKSSSPSSSLAWEDDAYIIDTDMVCTIEKPSMDTSSVGHKDE